MDCICSKSLSKYMDVKEGGLKYSINVETGKKTCRACVSHLQLCSSFSEPSCYLKQSSSSRELARFLSFFINFLSPSISSRFGILLNSVHQQTILADGNNVSGRGKNKNMY